MLYNSVTSHDLDTSPSPWAETWGAEFGGTEKKFSDPIPE